MARIRPTLHGSQVRGMTGGLEERLALARRHGYPGVDFTLRDVATYANGQPPVVRELLARQGIEASTVGGVLSADLFADDASFDTALEQLPARARLVRAIGASRTGTVLRPRALAPRETLWPAVVKRVQQVDRALASTGVRLGVEFLGVKTLYADRPHPFVQSMEAANTLLDEARVERVGLTLDSYHWYAGGDTLDVIRQTAGRRLVLLHVNDSKDMPRDELRDDDRLVPGEGVIPLVDWFRAIAGTGFDGFVGLEVLGPRLAEISVDERARLGLRAVEPLLRRAGVATESK